MSLVIDDKLPMFTNKLKSYADDAIREVARDTYIVAKNNAPYKKGRLRNEGQPIDKKGNAHYWVQFNAPYARYQEFGGDGRRIIRHYTTAGTGKNYLKNAGDKQATKIVSTIKKHLGRFGL